MTNTHIAKEFAQNLITALAIILILAVIAVTFTFIINKLIAIL